MKKILLNLGLLGMISSPVAILASCSDGSGSVKMNEFASSATKEIRSWTQYSDVQKDGGAVTHIQKSLGAGSTRSASTFINQSKRFTLPKLNTLIGQTTTGTGSSEPQSGPGTPVFPDYSSMSSLSEIQGSDTPEFKKMIETKIEEFVKPLIATVQFFIDHVDSTDSKKVSKILPGYIYEHAKFLKALAKGENIDELNSLPQSEKSKLLGRGRSLLNMQSNLSDNVIKALKDSKGQKLSTVLETIRDYILSSAQEMSAETYLPIPLDVTYNGKNYTIATYEVKLNDVAFLQKNMHYINLLTLYDILQNSVRQMMQNISYDWDTDTNEFVPAEETSYVNIDTFDPQSVFSKSAAELTKFSHSNSIISNNPQEDNFIGAISTSSSFGSNGNELEVTVLNQADYNALSSTVKVKYKKYLAIITLIQLAQERGKNDYNVLAFKIASPLKNIIKSAEQLYDMMHFLQPFADLPDKTIFGVLKEASTNKAMTVIQIIGDHILPTLFSSPTTSSIK